MDPPHSCYQYSLSDYGCRTENLGPGPFIRPWWIFIVTLYLNLTLLPCSTPGLSNLLHKCIFLLSWKFWFAHLDFYKNKPGPSLNPHKTSQKIWTIIAHSRFFAKIFAHLFKRLDTPGLVQQILQYYNDLNRGHLVRVRYSDSLITQVSLKW